jgi:hypothetical protein
MQFMILLRRSPLKMDTPVPAELREAEYEKVREFYLHGAIRDIWLRGDTPGACMIVEAGSKDEVEERLNILPLIQSGFLNSPIIVPLEPYAGFGPRAKGEMS